MNISDRQIKIIKLLEKAKTSLSSEQLSTILKVSSKTIKNDIKQINASSDKIVVVSKPGVGYQLADGKISLLENKYQNEEFEILNLLVNCASIDLFELSEKIFISEATLLRKVTIMNQLIEKEYGSNGIYRNNNLLYIDGEENKRRIFNLFLNKELDSHELSLSKYANYFKECDLDELTETIFEFHQSIAFELNDFSTISFVLHISILIERVSQGQFISYPTTLELDDESYDLAEQLILVLKKKLFIDIPHKELKYVAKLYSQKIVDGYLDENKISDLVDKMIKAVDENYFVNFSQNKVFKNYLVLHLNSLYGRALENKFLPNPLTEELKIKYPFIYTVTVYAVSIIQKEWKLTIPDDEIGYIVLHFLSAYKSIKVKDSKKVVLVSPLGQGNRLLIEQQLNTITKFSFEIIAHLSIFAKESISKNADLILSTVEISQKRLPMIYYFEQMLSKADLLSIEKLLLTQVSALIFDNYFYEDLFFANQDFSSKEEVIEFLCNKLVAKKIIESDYLQKVLERECLSSTSYGNYYAIPHGIKREAKENVIAVCILKKPIDWGEHKVKIVFLISLKPERDQSFEELFEQLFYLLEKKEEVSRLTSVTDYHAFLKMCNEICL